MPSFRYGSRVIENEQQVSLERHVKKIGNLLHAVVSSFATFLLFVLINILLSNFVQHTQLTFVKMFHIVQESAEILLSQSALSVISFTYQHSFCLMLALAFTCVYSFGLMLKSLVSAESKAKKEKETYSKDCREFDTQTLDSTVSYRHKVCFLS